MCQQTTTQAPGAQRTDPVSIQQTDGSDGMHNNGAAAASRRIARGVGRRLAQSKDGRPNGQRFTRKTQSGAPRAERRAA